MRLPKHLYSCFLSLIPSRNFPASFIFLSLGTIEPLPILQQGCVHPILMSQDISSSSLSVSSTSAMTSVCFCPSSSIREILRISFFLDLLLLLELTQQNFQCYLQGGEGDCFYVVGSGEFEVMATQVSFNKCSWSGVFYVLLLSSYVFLVLVGSLRLVFNLNLSWQEEKNGEVPRVLQRYTAEKLSSFGELALM